MERVVKSVLAIEPFLRLQPCKRARSFVPALDRNTSTRNVAKNNRNHMTPQLQVNAKEPNAVGQRKQSVIAFLRGPAFAP